MSAFVDKSAEERKARQAEAILAGECCRDCAHFGRRHSFGGGALCPVRALCRDPIPDWCTNFTQAGRRWKHDWELEG